MRTLLVLLTLSGSCAASDIVEILRISPRQFRITRRPSTYINAVGPSVGATLRMQPTPFEAGLSPRGYRKSYNLTAIARQRQRERYGARERYWARKERLP